MSLSEISIKNPVFAWMLMAFLIVFGTLSFNNMGISQMPDIDLPTVTITAKFPGAATEVMDVDVAEVIEGAISTIQGVTDIRSTSRTGVSSVVVEFDISKNIDVAVEEIQNALNGQRLPKNLDPITINKSNADSDPLIWLGVYSKNLSKKDLMKLVRDNVLEKFSNISGVGEVDAQGYREPNARIWLNPDLLAKNELTAMDVVSAIQAGHIEVPSGQIENSKQAIGIRTMGEFSSADQLSDILIQRRGSEPNYRPVKLKAIATLEDGLENETRLNWSDNVPSAGVAIQKQAGSNAVAVARAVRERVKEINASLPEGTSLGIRVDNSTFIEDSMNELYFTLLLAALLTAFVCLLFLGSWSATFNVVLAIPTSIIGAFIFMSALGFTLNFFTMLALTLAIGIVVDDSIMVLENIVRYRELGDPRVKAARRGAKEITLAATAATIAVIAIYLPIAFMPGIVGRYLFQFGVTLSLAVLLSLLEALTLTPMRCAQFLSVSERTTFIGRGIEHGFDSLAVFYKKAVGFTLKYRVIVIVVGVGLFASSLLFLSVLKREFIPAQDQSRIIIRFSTPVGSSLEFTRQKYIELEAIISKRAEVKSTFAGVGALSGVPNFGFFYLNFKPKSERPINPDTGKRFTQQELIPVIRAELSKVKDLKISMVDPSLNTLGQRRSLPVEFTIRGPDYDKLLVLGDEVMKKMRESGVFVDVDSDYQEGLKELRLEPDREKARAYSVSMAEIAQTVQALMSGLVVGQLTDGSHRNDIRLQVPNVDRVDPAVLSKFNIRNDHGELIPLMKLVTVKEHPSAYSITRESRSRAVTISSNLVTGKAQADGIAKVNEISAQIMEPGYRVFFSGSSQTFQDSFRGLLLVLILGIAVSYMVLASQFNSFIHPLTVLIALPFSVSGAMVALYLTGQTLNIYSMLAILLLMGIVKKNSILLVDFTNRKRASGLSVSEALKEACPVRLRPILMTSIATIAAAVPPAIAAGPGAESRIPMAIAVIGGVAVSTFMTLFVVPSVYSLLSHLERKTYVPEQDSH